MDRKIKVIKLRKGTILNIREENYLAHIGEGKPKTSEKDKKKRA